MTSGQRGVGMKLSKFDRERTKYEKRKKRNITDDEFDRILRRRRVSQWIGDVLALIIGLAMIAEWPAAWIGPFTTYMGWAFVVLILASLLRDALTGEGTFYRLNRASSGE
jgi:hypothetical protein